MLFLVLLLSSITVNHVTLSFTMQPLLSSKTLSNNSAATTRNVNLSRFFSTPNQPLLETDSPTTCNSSIPRSHSLEKMMASTRRSVLIQTLLASIILMGSGQPSVAVGPTKILLRNFRYSAKPCPKDKPIPGEKAMKGMRGLCVSVTADLQESPEKDLSKVGVYGFVTDAATGDSVLANNPDLSTDSGQFAMIEAVSTQDSSVTFEFIAAIPMEKDISKETNGIGNLDFESIRIVSYPGGNQFGAVGPCEMNEFSQECEDWEAVNGPYQRGTFMMERNPRTRAKGG